MSSDWLPSFYNSPSIITEIRPAHSAKTDVSSTQGCCILLIYELGEVAKHLSAHALMVKKSKWPLPIS
jgi:hypothetical protein